MPTKRARLQVILADDATERVKALAEENGLSVSSMCSQLIHTALQLKQFQPKSDPKSSFKAKALAAAIAGAEIGPDIKQLLSIFAELPD